MVTKFVIVDPAAGTSRRKLERNNNDQHRSILSLRQKTLELKYMEGWKAQIPQSSKKKAKLYKTKKVWPIPRKSYLPKRFMQHIVQQQRQRLSQGKGSIFFIKSPTEEIHVTEKRIKAFIRKNRDDCDKAQGCFPKEKIRCATPVSYSSIDLDKNAPENNPTLDQPVNCSVSSSRLENLSDADRESVLDESDVLTPGTDEDVVDGVGGLALSPSWTDILQLRATSTDDCIQEVFDKGNVNHNVEGDHVDLSFTQGLHTPVSSEVFGGDEAEELFQYFAASQAPIEGYFDNNASFPPSFYLQEEGWCGDLIYCLPKT